MISLTPEQLLFLLRGFGWTIVLSLLAFVGGGALGFVLALTRVYATRPLRTLATLYIKLIQGTPLLILLFLTYFGLPALGLVVEPLLAAAMGLSIYVSAYLGEIWRGSLEAVPRTQEEAAACLALNWHQRLIHVILPQAVKIATPPTVGFIELVRAGQMINNATFRPFIVFVLIAALYFALCYPLSAWSRRLEGKFDAAHR